MKHKLAYAVLLFLALTITVCIGVLSKTKWLICASSIASAALGSVISVILDAVDSHGQNVKLWFQSLKYRNKDIRLSVSYLYRIQINGKYLMTRGNRLRNQYQPIGGVYKYYQEAKPMLERLGYQVDARIGNNKETDDLRVVIKGKYILRFIEWFQTMKDREYAPSREFYEELDKRILPMDKFRNLQYRKVHVHISPIQYSQYLQCNELLYSDIFELKLSQIQKELIVQAVKKNPKELCLVSKEEIERLCYNGVEKNLGTNSPWILEA